MAEQMNNPAMLLDEEKKVLDFEKKYTDILCDFLKSKEFIDRLKRMFIELDKDKVKIVDEYGGISIINTPAERLVTYCVYDEFFKRRQAGISEFTTVEFYSFPQCGDLAIELLEVVLSIEVKTICITSNPGDLGYLPFRENQTSFENICEYSQSDASTGYKPNFKVTGHLPKWKESKPVLSFVVEIVYEFDKKNSTTSQCKLYSDSRKDGTSTINLFCIPNGFIGRLFGNNIFQNVKSYKFYPNEGYSSLIKIDEVIYPQKNNCLTDIKSTYAYLKTNFSKKITADWIEANQVDYITYIDTSKIGNEHHEKDGMLWILTEKQDSTKLKRPVIRPVKKPDGCRINWKLNLVERFDSSGNPWKGVRNIQVK